MLIDIFQQSDDVNKQDVNTLFTRIDEALSIWAWRRAHPRLEFSGEALFGTTLSSLLTLTDKGFQSQEIIFLRLQSLLSKSSVASDPLVMPLRIEMYHISFEETFHKAIRHFEAGRWAYAMSLLKSQDAAIDLAIGLEDAYKNKLNSHELHGLRGNARLTRVEFDMQLAICSASQLIHTGDQHFKEAENCMAEEMMGHAQLAQDDYRYNISFVSCPLS